MPLQALIGGNWLSLRAAFRHGHSSLPRRPVLRKQACRVHSSKARVARPVQRVPLLSPAHSPLHKPYSSLKTFSSDMLTVQQVTSEFLLADDLPAGTHLHLIVLNYVLPQQTAQLWHRATTRICADGGANRLYDQIVEMLPGVDPLTARSSFLPDLIKGDLDSVRQDVQDFYTSRGVPMIDLSSDQETTDLEKCLLFLEGRLRAMSEQRTPGAPSAAEAAAPQHGPASEAVLTAAAAAATVAVSRNGLGHGAKAIGAVNAHKAPNGNGASTSHSSSFSVAYTQVGPDIAGLDSSLVQPEGSACAGVSNGAEPSVQQQHLRQRQPDDAYQHHHHCHHHHHHHMRHERHHSQQQEQPGAVVQPVLGRVVMLDNPGSSVQTAGLQQAQQHVQQQLAHPVDQQQQQQQMQPGTAEFDRLPETEVSASPGSPSSSSSSQDGTRGRARPSSSGSLSGGGVHEVAATVLGSNDTHFEPALKRLKQDHVILVLGALGGRLDHTLSNLNTLYCYRHLNMALWGDGNLVRLLRAGTAHIQPARAEGPTCGLVPLARPATASSTGLKWDLDNTHMCFRGLLSTSNIISSDSITVSTDEDLLWITAVEDSTSLSRAG